MNNEQEASAPQRMIPAHDHDYEFAIGNTAIIRGCTICGVAYILSGSGAGTWRSSWEQINEPWHIVPRREIVQKPMPVVTHEELGRRLRLAREDAGIKQYEAAEAINLDATAISKIEHGDRIINALELGRLAKLYQVAVDNFLKSGEETR